ncbi:MAG: hypothetical protein ACSLE2_05925 [Lysobacterales bacterium]
MTICPVALAVGCKKCPVFNVCPVKTTLGNYRPQDEASPGKSGSDNPSGSSGPSH